MELINMNSNYYGYPKDKMWYAVQFSIVNPTASPFTIDLFNGYNQVPIPVVPNIPVSPFISDTITYGVDSKYNSAYCSANNTLYVPSNADNSIYVIDCNTNLLVDTVVCMSPVGIAYNLLNNCMYYVSDSGLGTSVIVIDCATNLIISTISTSLYSADQYICFNSINNTMYVSSSSNNLTVIDCSNNTLLTTVPIGSYTLGLAYNPNNNLIYVSSPSTDNIVLISGSNNTVYSSVSAPLSPAFLSYNTFNNSMYVSCNTSNNISIINCNTNTINTTISVGANPFYSVYSPYDNYIYVSNQGSLDVSIINCFTNTVFDTISYNVSNPPFGLTYNSVLKNVYLGNGANVDVIYTYIKVPYITGSTDYNQFVRELQNIPKRVRHIRLTVESYSQMAVPFYLLTRDANGNFCGDPKIPTEYLRPSDYQSFICELPFKPKELILNNNEIISQYTVAPYSTVGMVLYFDEIDMSDLLSEKLNVYNQIETKVEDLNTISEATLDRRYENRPILKPEWLKNFKGGKVIKI